MRRVSGRLNAQERVGWAVIAFRCRLVQKVCLVCGLSRRGVRLGRGGGGGCKSRFTSRARVVFTGNLELGVVLSLPAVSSVYFGGRFASRSEPSILFLFGLRRTDAPPSSWLRKSAETPHRFISHLFYFLPRQNKMEPLCSMWVSSCLALGITREFRF